jgi:hypothetical protein
MLQHWLAFRGEEIRKAHPQPNTGEDILRDAAIYLERLQSQARRVILGYIRLLEKKKKFAH